MDNYKEGEFYNVKINEKKNEQNSCRENSTVDKVMNKRDFFFKISQNILIEFWISFRPKIAPEMPIFTLFIAIIHIMGENFVPIKTKMCMIPNLIDIMLQLVIII